jgi:uncharacterized protein YeaO (DUF488 family)
MMLSRYTIYRRRPKDAGPLPSGVRKDTRWRTRHVLRPTQELVETFLADPSDEAWEAFREGYLALLADRFADDRRPFDEFAEIAMVEDVYIGCSCPTKKNPDVRHCHTYLSLEFMDAKYPELEVIYPES